MIEKFKSLHNAEPLAVRTAIVAVATAMVHAALILGLVHLSADQQDTINSNIDWLAGIVAVVWARRAVRPAYRLNERQEPAEPVSEPVSVGRHAASDGPPVPAAEPADLPALPSLDTSSDLPAL